MATFTNTIIAFTIADSCVPLINNKVNSNKIIKAGAFIIPVCDFPSASVMLSKGEWHHS